MAGPKCHICGKKMAARWAEALGIPTRLYWCPDHSTATVADEEGSEVMFVSDPDHLTTCEDCGAPPGIACSKCWPIDAAPSQGRERP